MNPDASVNTSSDGCFSSDESEIAPSRQLRKEFSTNQVSCSNPAEYFDLAVRTVLEDRMFKQLKYYAHCRSINEKILDSLSTQGFFQPQIQSKIQEIKGENGAAGLGGCIFDFLSNYKYTKFLEDL